MSGERPAREAAFWRALRELETISIAHADAERLDGRRYADHEQAAHAAATLATRRAALRMAVYLAARELATAPAPAGDGGAP